MTLEIIHTNCLHCMILTTIRLYAKHKEIDRNDVLSALVQAIAEYMVAYSANPSELAEATDSLCRLMPEAIDHALSTLQTASERPS